MYLINGKDTIHPMSTLKHSPLRRHTIISLMYSVLCILLLPGIVYAAEDFPIPGIGGLTMYEAVYASDTIPDVLTSESQYPATISFQNKGLAQWRENSKEKFGLLYQGGQSSVEIDPLFNFVPEGVAISNSEEATFSFLVQTPKKPGTYPISFTMAILKAGRYEPFEQAFTKTIRIVPKSGASSAQFGAISVMSAPPLSEIYLGGEFVGRTPFIIADLTPATYRVRVIDGTYGSKEVAVQVARGSVTEVVFDLIDNEKTRITTEKIYEYTLTGRFASFAPSIEAMVGIIIFFFFLAVLWIFKREEILKHPFIASLMSGVGNAMITAIAAISKKSPPSRSTKSPSPIDAPREEGDQKRTHTDNKAVDDEKDTRQTQSEGKRGNDFPSEMAKAKQSTLNTILRSKSSDTSTGNFAKIAKTIDTAQKISLSKPPQAIPDLFATSVSRAQKSNQDLKRPTSTSIYKTPKYENRSIKRTASATKGSSSSGHQILSILEKSDPDAYIHPEDFSGIQFQSQVDGAEFPDQLRDRYEPLDILGEDAYARVFKVKTIPDGEVRALKISHDTQAASEILMKEANIWRNMRHANVVKMYASDFSHDLKFAEQEYQIGFMYKGKHYISLREIPKPIREKYALSIVVDIARGLDYAHTLGIRHYHIFLGNIMITSDFRAKLSGFLRGKNEMGPAFSYSTIDPDASDEELAHLAPEQRSADAGTLGTRTDMYQLGIIFYELLTGYVPYSQVLYEQVYGEKEEKDLDMENIEEKMRTMYIPPSLLFPILARYDEILAKLISHDKKKRYASIREFIAEIEEICAEMEIEIPAFVFQQDDEEQNNTFSNTPYQKLGDNT